MQLKGQPSKADLALEAYLLQNPESEIPDAVEFYLEQGQNEISMEEVRDYSPRAVGFIATDAASINEWLVKSLDHLDERMEEYGSMARSFDEQARHLAKTKTEGGFAYRSIMRNLSTGNSVNNTTLAVELDKFLTKIQSILSYGTGSEFQKLLSLIQSYELGEEGKLEAIFAASRAYYRTMLPSNSSKEIYGLQMHEGRELWLDRTVYLGGKVFYSYTPTELSESSGSLWSGFVRTTKSDLDLKTEVPFLTKAQCQAVSKTLQRHATGLLKAKAYQHTAEELLALARALNRKYVQARKQRKQSTKPLILLMNMVVSHLYGIQVKAINQAEGTYKAALKYVAKSIEAMEENKPA